MSEYFIEDYNGVKITYDEMYDRFRAEGLHDGNKIGHTRASLRELKEHLAKTLTQVKKKKFEPVEVYYVEYGKCVNAVITNIRADSGIQVKRETDDRPFKMSDTYGYAKLVKKTDSNRILVEEINALNAEIEKLQQQVEQKNESLTRFDVEKMLDDFYAE